MSVRGSWKTLVAVTAVLLIGCGGAEELRSGEQAGEFIDDVVRGGKIDDWKLADDATSVATTTWLNEATIRRVGVKLRDEGPQWACDAAEQVDRVGKIIEGVHLAISGQDRAEIVTSAQLQGADSSAVNSLIDEALKLGPFDLAETISAACAL